MIGGSISSLDQIFEFEAAKHQGFEVKQRADDDSESEN